MSELHQPALRKCERCRAEKSRYRQMYQGKWCYVCESCSQLINEENRKLLTKVNENDNSKAAEEMTRTFDAATELNQAMHDAVYDGLSRYSDPDDHIIGVLETPFVEELIEFVSAFVSPSSDRIIKSAQAMFQSYDGFDDFQNQAWDALPERERERWTNAAAGVFYNLAEPLLEYLARGVGEHPANCDQVIWRTSIGDYRVARTPSFSSPLSFSEFNDAVKHCSDELRENEHIWMRESNGRYTLIEPVKD